MRRESELTFFEYMVLGPRRRCPGSGRRTTATLTDAGHRAVVAAAPAHVTAVREYLIDRLEPRDLAALRRIGSAVEAAVRDVGAGPGDGTGRVTAG